MPSLPLLSPSASPVFPASGGRCSSGWVTSRGLRSGRRSSGSAEGRRAVGTGVEGGRGPGFTPPRSARPSTHSFPPPPPSLQLVRLCALCPGPCVGRLSAEEQRREGKWVRYALGERLPGHRQQGRGGGGGSGPTEREGKSATSACAGSGAGWRRGGAGCPGCVRAAPDAAGTAGGGHDLVVEATASPGLATP